MRKRLLSIFLILVFLICLFPGCGSPVEPDPSTTEGSESTTGPSTQSSDTPTTEPATEPTEPSTEPPTEPTEPPMELDFFTRYGQGQLSDSGWVPGYAQQTQTAHLYTLPLEITQAENCHSIITHGNLLYLFYWRYQNEMPEGNACTVYDLQTGTTRFSLEIPSWAAYGPLDNGGMWVVAFAELQVTLYDASGEPYAVYDLDIPDSRTDTITNASVTFDGNYLIVMHNQGDPITLFDLQAGSSTVPEFPDNIMFWSEGVQQQGFLLNDYEGNVYMLDPATGSSQPYDLAINSDQFFGELGCHTNEHSLLLAGADGDPTCFYMQLEQGEWLTDLGFGCAAIQYFDMGQILRFYDLRGSKYLGQIRFSDDCYWINAQIMDNGSVVIVEYGESGTEVYLYDLASAAAAEDAQPIDTMLCTQEEIQQRTAQLAEQVLDSTGIELLYGSQGNDFVLYDYIGAAELDTYKVYESVSTVAEVLAEYPDGMLRQAWDITNDGLKIYLCGTLYGINYASLDAAGGVTADVGNYIIVAMDVNNDLESVLHHELSHVFDRRISAVSSQAETNWMMLWDELHPFPDAYTNSYDEYYLNTAYTDYEEFDEENIWFIDPYARTFATEDRAQIMQYLFESTDDGLHEVLRYENLQDKARLYCYILRQCFPACDIEGVLPWEMHLGTIDESVLPQ